MSKMSDIKNRIISTAQVKATNLNKQTNQDPIVRHMQINLDRAKARLIDQIAVQLRKILGPHSIGYSYSSPTNIAGRINFRLEDEPRLAHQRKALAKARKVYDDQITKINEAKEALLIELDLHGLDERVTTMIRKFLMN